MSAPNLFIVGAPKCGTTALGHYLSSHPEVYVAAKELSYFGSDLDFRTRQGRPWRISREDYLGWFAGHEAERYRVDRSVFYLYSHKAAHEIAQHDPQSRVIAMVRDPVDQMHSEHSEMVFQGEEDITDFAEALAAEPERRAGRRVPAGCQHVFGLYYRELCRYAPQIERYLDELGPGRVHVVVHEDLVRDPAATYRGVLEFLGVDPGHRPEFAVVNGNKVPRSTAVTRALRTSSPALRRAGRAVVRSAAARAGVRRRLQSLNTRTASRTPLPGELRRSLRAELEPEVLRLRALLGRDLPWHDEPGGGRP